MKRVMIVIGISVFICISLVCQKSTAPEPEQGDGQWTTYTTSDGLPYDAVGAIAFGPDGELWCVPLIPDIGGGVAHFDGNTWKHYTTKDGLGSDLIIWFENTLTVSSDGILWVGTFGGVSPGLTARPGRPTLQKMVCSPIKLLLLRIPQMVTCGVHTRRPTVEYPISTGKPGLSILQATWV